MSVADGIAPHYVLIGRQRSAQNETVARTDGTCDWLVLRDTRTMCNCA